MKMRKLVIPLITVLTLLYYQNPCLSENYYKWVDKDGVTHVTDNPQKIPPQYRTSLEIVKEKDTGFKAFRKKIQKAFKDNKTLFLYSLGALIGLFIIIKLLKIIKNKSKEYKKGRFDEIMKKSGIDLMTIPQFKLFTKNLLSAKGFKIKELESDLDFGIDYIAEKSNSHYLVKVISDNMMTSRTLLNDIMRDTTRYGCDKALIISKNFFSDDAVEFSKSAPCDLVDRHALGQWIKDSKLF